MVRRREALYREASEIQRATRPGSAVSDREKTGGVARDGTGAVVSTSSRRFASRRRSSETKRLVGEGIRRSENEGRRHKRSERETTSAASEGILCPQRSQRNLVRLGGRRVRSASETATRRKSALGACLYLLFLAPASPKCKCAGGHFRRC